MYNADDLMELLWQDGKLVMNQTNRKTEVGGDASTPPPGQQFMLDAMVSSWLMMDPKLTGELGYIAPLQPDNSNTVLVKDSTVVTTAVERSNLTQAAAELGFPRVLPVATWNSGTSNNMSSERPSRPPAPLDRKGKTHDVEADVEPDAHKVKNNKEVHGSLSTKKSRAAAAHSSSERRRRNRINEKLKTLQELIPHSHKTDKVTLLDDAIHYFKSLQHMVQVMSIGYGMASMMNLGMSYMPSTTPGVNLITSTNQPIMSYPASSEHLTPEFPIPTSDQNLAQPEYPAGAMYNLQQLQVLTQPQIPDFHPYQPYLSVHPSQSVLSQNQAVVQHSSCEPDSFCEKKSES